MHLRPSPRQGCFPTRHGKHFQFGVKKGHISKLGATSGDIIQLIPFVHAFYAFESPMFYNHHNHEGDIIVIPWEFVKVIFWEGYYSL